MKLIDQIIEHIQSKKGRSISVLNLTKLTAISDYFVICSADSEPQVKAIADEIVKKLADEGIKCYHKEGYDTLNWVLLDYLDVVVHVFRSEARKFYNLERLWADAKITEYPDVD